MKAATLAVGTELTIGQVMNRNSHWIATQLYSHGIASNIHLTVPDDRRLILQALRYIEPECQLLFITGGLGPTTDDFTRDLVAEWAGAPLEHDPGSWEHVQNILKPRGIPVREAQRQQCLFPKGSQILTNSRGTANGFSLKVRQCMVFVLPGPPKEIEGLWESYINPYLKSLSTQLDPVKFISWDTIGKGESEIAHLVEPVVAELSAGKILPVEVGYRVHLPFVEVKLIFNESNRKALTPLFARLEEALAPYTLLRNGDSPAHLFVRSLKASGVKQVNIFDRVTGGQLLQRVKELLLAERIHFRFEQAHADSSPAPTSNSAPPAIDRFAHQRNQLEMELESRSYNELKITLRKGILQRQISLQSPYQNPSLEERRQLYFAEMALMKVAQVLSE